MDWYAKHQNKWYRVAQVKDTGIPAGKPGGGNNYHLDGVDEPVHQSKIEKLSFEKPEEMEKQEPMMIRETVDGKREFIPGVEPLRQRWEKIKKALDNQSAILDIGAQEFHDTSDLEEQPEDDENAPEEDDQSSPEQPEDDENAPEEDQQPDDAETSSEESSDPEDQLAELVELLSQQGHSEAEINYIVHGHVMPTTSLDDAKVDSEQAMAQHKLDHAKRMSDVEHTQAQKELDTNDLDKQHKQRLLDLEYEYAKKEKEMEVDFKTKEYELKLQAIKNKQEQPSKSTKVDYAQSRSQDAKQTSQKELKGE